MGWKPMLLPYRVARELGVGQLSAADDKLIGANRLGRGELQADAGSATQVVHFDAVAAGAERADQHAVAIKRKSAAEQINAVRQSGVRRDARRWRHLGRL